MRGVYCVASAVLGMAAALWSVSVEAAGKPEMWLGLRYKVSASSELKSPDHRYAAQNVMPTSLGKAWCEGVPGDGKGQWLELTLKPPIKFLTELDIEILPGYITTLDTYRKNNRPRKIAVYINDQRKPTVVTLEDYGRLQMFQFKHPPWPLKKIRLKILEVYKGTQYQDTCITQVVLQDWPEPTPPATFDDNGRMQYSPKERMYHKAQSQSGTRDYMSFIMGLGDSNINDGGPGEELSDDYVWNLVKENPGRFLWVLDKQTDRVAKYVIDATIHPATADGCSAKQVLDALQKGMKGLDVQSIARFKPLLDAYNIK